MVSRGEMELPFEWVLNREVGAPEMPVSDARNTCRRLVVLAPDPSPWGLKQMLAVPALQVPGNSRWRSSPRPHPG